MKRWQGRSAVKMKQSAFHNRALLGVASYVLVVPDGNADRRACAGQTSNLSAGSGRRLSIDSAAAPGLQVFARLTMTSHSTNSKMRILRSLALLAGIAATATDAVSVGDAIPSNIDLHFGFPPEMINVGERVAKKKVIIVGLPGAFTPT